jgi:hypothetical protein
MAGTPSRNPVYDKRVTDPAGRAENSEARFVNSLAKRVVGSFADISLLLIRVNG